MDQGTCGRPELAALAERLYSEHRGRLLMIARQNSDQEDDAEEALNEAFCLFLAKFDSGRFPEPVSWLTTTLKRVCWGTARRAERERPEFGQELERRAQGASILTNRPRSEPRPGRCARRWPS